MVLAARSAEPDDESAMASDAVTLAPERPAGRLPAATLAPGSPSTALPRVDVQRQDASLVVSRVPPSLTADIQRLATISGALKRE